MLHYQLDQFNYEQPLDEFAMSALSVKRAFRMFSFKKYYNETMVKQLWQFFGIFSLILILSSQETKIFAILFLLNREKRFPNITKLIGHGSKSFQMTDYISSCSVAL